MKTYVLCGGGSGGHITPLLAVARELKHSEKDARVIYVGERGGKFSYIAEQSKLFDELHFISAGKLRRYHGESWLRRLIDVKTNYLNLRDSVRIVRGIMQSRTLFRALHADALLLKGGYVCVPAALGAKSAKVPMITHDSDALPGLSNRIAARYAVAHATAMPAQYYSYPKKSVRFVGLPVDQTLFRPYSKAEQRFLREKYNIPADSFVLLITGGSNGARRMNEWCIEVLPDLLDAYPKLYVIHLVGAGNENQYSAVHEAHMQRVRVEPFSADMHHISAISDLVITRAGASTLVEFAAASKPCIVIPNPDLTGGHQLKNAKVYEDQQSVVVVQEKALRVSAEPLQSVLVQLIEDTEMRTQLGTSLHRTLPELPAAHALAQLLRKIDQI